MSKRKAARDVWPMLTVKHAETIAAYVRFTRAYRLKVGLTRGGEDPPALMGAVREIERALKKQRVRKERGTAPPPKLIRVDGAHYRRPRPGALLGWLKRHMAEPNRLTAVDAYEERDAGVESYTITIIIAKGSK